jgi:hypothetical protein
MDWNSKERGARLCEYQGIRGFYLGCTPCNRWIEIELEEAVELFGAETYLRDAAGRIRCNLCGERKGYIMAWAETRNRR